MIKLLSLLEHQTKGVDEFTAILSSQFTQVDKLLWNDMNVVIENTSCPKIRFESLHPTVGGISKSDECIINTNILQYNISQCLFIIFHEIAHQFQYKKYGKDFALSVYVDDNTINETLNKLIQIESTADRFAAQQTTKLCNRYNIPINFQQPQYNNPQSKQMLITYISQLRNVIKQRQLTNIDSINDFLYNMIKTQL